MIWNRIRALREDRGSMPLLLMVMLAGMALGALMIPMIITQDRATRFDTSRVHALDAAQAGIDTVVGEIRASVDSNGIGVSAYLPCGPVTGSVNGVGQAAYRVTIEYFTADPVLVPSTPQMICAAGYGTYDSATGLYTPSFARLTATGTDGPSVNGSSKGRTLVTTYKFLTSNINISGGVIRLYPAPGATVPVCMDAGSATPTAGTQIKLANCSTTSPPAQQQIFSYRNDLTIQLLSSVTTSNPKGLCLDTAAPLINGNPITLQTCTTFSASPLTWYSQQWSFDDNGHFRGSLLTSSTTGALSNICISSATQTPPQAIIAATCAGSTDDPTQAWIPSPAVGAGAADAPQWVNYREFGRCLDITGQNVNADHLIDYPCKQNPYAGAVAFNQKFSQVVRPNGKTQLSTVSGVTTYCLTSTGVDGGYTTVSPCSSTNARQEWTVYGGTAGLAYRDKYTVVDATNLCLGLTVPVGSEQWSAIVNETCDGSTEQKWNASPNLTVPSLQNTNEK